MAVTTLSLQLRRVGRRLLTVAAAAGVGVGLTAALAAVLLAAWVDPVWALPPFVRIAGLAAAVALGTGVIAVAVARALRQRRPDALARRLDDAGDTGGVIRAGVDLIGHNGDSTLSAGLAALAVERAG